MTRISTQLREPATASYPWFLGSTREFLRDPLEMGLRGFAECGDVVRFVVGVPGLRREFFVVNHPDGAAQLLNAPTNQNYRKDSGFYQPIRDLYGNGLVTSQDETWLRQRRFIQPLFTARSVDGYAAAMAEEVDRIVAQWRTRPDGVVDVGSEMTRLTLSCSARTRRGWFRSCGPHFPFSAELSCDEASPRSKFRSTGRLRRTSGSPAHKIALTPCATT